MYTTETARVVARDFGGNFDAVSAGEVWAEGLRGAGTDNMMELTLADRKRIFNLGYYTWVEQQGVSIEEFTRRRDQSFWQGLRDLLPAWDAMIEDFNQSTGVAAGL
jgi:hypothetical protein